MKLFCSKSCFQVEAENVETAKKIALANKNIYNKNVKRRGYPMTISFCSSCHREVSGKR